MYTREKHSLSGNLVKIKYTISELFLEVKKESALLAKHLKTENPEKTIIDSIITDDETILFDKVSTEVASLVSMILKSYGLDRNDITPEYAKKYYYYKPINETETLGFISQGETPEVVFYLKDTGSSGQNILSLVDTYLKKLIVYKITGLILDEMNPEISVFFHNKAQESIKLLSDNLFYMC